MAAVNNILGIETFSLGAPGDGVMGGTLVNFPDVEVGSVNLEGSQANTETISTEGADAYITLNNDASPTVVTARLYGVTPAQMVLLAGGSVDGDFWLAPEAVADIFLSLEIKGKPNGGKQAVIQVPYAKITARDQGTITKNGLPAVDLTITANTPVAADGTRGATYQKGFIDIV